MTINMPHRYPKSSKALLRDVERCLRKLPTTYHIDPELHCITRHNVNPLEDWHSIGFGDNGAVIVAVRETDEQLYYKVRAYRSSCYMSCVSIYEAIRYILNTVYSIDIGDEFDQPISSIVDASKPTLRRLVKHRIVSVVRLRWIACTVAGHKTRQINKWCDAKLATLRDM